VEQGKSEKGKMSGSGSSNKSEKPPASANDYDFRHHLHDTIILLGGKRRIARLLIKSQDFRITPSDLDHLRKYNGSLIDNLKGRLANINKTRIRPKSG
jgi:hypothetical protein